MKKTTYINLHWPITSHSFVVRFTTILSLETLVNYPAGLWQRRVLEWWEWELDWGNYPDRPWIDIWWNIVDFWQFGDRVFSLIVNQTGSNHCKQNIVKKWYWSSDSSNVVSVRTKHGFAINNSGFICLVVLKVSNILICLPVYHVSPIEMGWWYMNIYDDSHWVFFCWWAKITTQMVLAHLMLYAGASGWRLLNSRFCGWWLQSIYIPYWSLLYIIGCYRYIIIYLYFDFFWKLQMWCDPFCALGVAVVK